jgi:hypothetical protein
MRNFHFHLIYPNGRRLDLGVAEFDSMEAACSEAYQAALEIVIEMLRKREDPNPYRFEVFDDDGAMVFEILFSEIVHPRKPDPYLHFSRVCRGMSEDLRRNAQTCKAIRGELAEAHRRLREIRSSLLR